MLQNLPLMDRADCDKKGEDYCVTGLTPARWASGRFWTDLTAVRQIRADW